MSGSRSPRSAPLFLIGFPRSGTTLLRLFLDAHSQIAIPFESFVLIDFHSRLSEYGDLQSLEARVRLVDDLLAAKGIRSWKPPVFRADVNLARCTAYASTIDEIFSAYARRCGKTMWGDKTPSYTSHIDVLNELFPEARFVHLVRDGRDAALSLMRQPWGPKDFISAFSQWNEIVSWSRKMGRLLPSTRYMELRFEDLVDNPQKVLRRVTEFLGLSFEASMLQAHLSASEKLPERSFAFHTHIQGPIDRGLTFQWQERMTTVDQAIALKIGGELLRELGYLAVPVQVAPFRVHARTLWHHTAAAVQWRLRRFRKRRQRTKER